MFWIKILLTTALITTIAVVVRFSERLGAFLGALPWVAVLVLCWMYVEQKPNANIARFSRLTFWYVLPSLPLFLVVAEMQDKGFSFWWSLLAGIGTALVCFGGLVFVARGIGIELLP